MAARKDQQFETVLGAFREAGKGYSLEEIAARIGAAIPRRTLIRRLSEMVEGGLITKSGTSRAARYYRGGGEAAKAQKEEARQLSLLVPLSKASGAILREVTKRPELRKPAGYNRAFLDDYRPNETGYLTTAEKAKLLNLGRTDGGEQPAGTYAKQILQRLLIDLSWNSSRLEGNTYSLLDTQRLIDLGEAAEGKAAKDAQMILNHKAAIEFLVQDADLIGFNRRTILNLHALLADNLLGDPSAPGRLRREAIAISQSVYHPLEVPQLIAECFESLLAKASEIEDPFEQSFFLMVQLPYLQPFIDVNKRVSRLAANIPLIKANVAPLSFVAVPDSTYTQGMLGVYELNRVELLKDVFLWAYERSSARYAALRQSLGEPDPFRVRYRLGLREVVAEVIRGPMDQKAAGRFIETWASDNIAEDDRPRFIEEAESELLGLHEGNYARYRIRPSEFEAWRKAWQIAKGTKSKRRTKSSP